MKKKKDSEDTLSSQFDISGVFRAPTVGGNAKPKENIASGLASKFNLPDIKLEYNKQGEEEEKTNRARTV